MNVFDGMFVISGCVSILFWHLNRSSSSLNAARREKTIFFLRFDHDYDPKEDNFSKWTFCHVLNYHSTFFSPSFHRSHCRLQSTLDANLCEWMNIISLVCSRSCKKDAKYINVIVAGFKATHKIHWWKSWHLNCVCFGIKRGEVGAKRNLRGSVHILSNIFASENVFLLST